MINTLLKLIPFKKETLQYGASLKIASRNPLETRFYNKLSTLIRNDNEKNITLTTNLGISDSYKVLLPIGKTPGGYLFGLPDDYMGERTVLYLSKYLANHCDAVADIGANWGFYSYFMAKHSQKPIYYFEPNTELYDNIVMNIQNHNLQNRVIGSPQAVAAKSGELSFYINLSDNFSSSLTNYFENSGHKIKKITLDAINFDDFVAKHNYKNWLAKVDIEDAEFQFLEGAEKAMQQGILKYLIIELLENARKNKFIDKMIEKGWNAYYLNDYHIEHVSKEDGRYTAPEYNWLFCKETPQELRKLLHQTRFSVID